MWSRWLGRDLERLLERGRQELDLGLFAPAAESFEAAARAAAGRGRAGRAEALGLCATARVQLGLARFHAGRDVEAEAELGRALIAHSGHVQARYVRARIYHRSGRHREAVADLAAAIAAQPDGADLHLLLASTAEQGGDAGTAARALDRALRITLAAPCAGGCEPSLPARGPDPGDPRPPRRRRPEPARARQVRQGLEALALAVRERPSYADLRHHRALLLLELGRADEAETELERALRVNPRYLAARLLLSRLQIGRGAERRAVRALEALRDVHPGYPDLHYWLGLGRLRLGDVRGAAAALEIAVALNREFARAQRLLGLVQHRLGEAGPGWRAIRRGFTRDREVPEPRPLPAPPLPGAAAAAEPELRRALALQPDYPDLHLAFARARRSRGDLEHAAESCRRALGLKPDYSTAALELARIEVGLGRPHGAVGLLMDLVRRHPRWADAQALLGHVSRLRGDVAGAQGPLRAALSLNPAYAQAREDLAWALGAERSLHGRAPAAFAAAAWTPPRRDSTGAGSGTAL